MEETQRADQVKPHRRAILFGLFAAPLFAQGRGKAKGQHKGGDDGDHDHDQGRSSVYFRPEDRVVVQHYYTGPRNLPPGLAKKYQRTGSLPPGWEKKMRPFPAELVRVLPPPPPNCERGYIDGVAVVYDRKTRIILDSIDLIAAIAGH